MVLASKLLPHIDARDRQPDDRSQNGAGPNENKRNFVSFLKKRSMQKLCRNRVRELDNVSNGGGRESIRSVRVLGAD